MDYSYIEFIGKNERETKRMDDYAFFDRFTKGHS